MTEIPFHPRELEAVRLLMRGLTDKEIARELKLSPCTTKGLLRDARLRTGAPNRIMLALWAERNGIAS